MLRRRHPLELVARAKGLLTLCSAKTVGRVLNIPWRTVQDWQSGQCYADIQPDLAIRETIFKWARGEERQ